jgi:uncharacterized protein (TIGR03382 family)
MNMKAQVTIGLVAVVGFATAASAAVLWDQSNYDTAQNALVDQEFDDYPTYSSYMVMDVVSTDWVVDSISVFFTSDYSGGWGGVNQARLNVFDWVPGNLPLGGDDPTAGTVVPVTLTEQGDATWKITASGLDLAMPAGNYWVGLTPLTNFGSQGQEFHRPAPIVGDNTAWRNPGGSFGYGSDWNYVYVLGYWQDEFDGSILIEGVPAPGALALLGLAGLVSRRRR